MSEGRIDRWKNAWDNKKAMWHNDEPQPHLVKNLDKLTVGKKDARILLPLCGKAGDIMWLYNQGYSIVGVEGVAYVVEEFFNENNLEFLKEEVKEIGGFKFSSKDGRLVVFACDFFKITSEHLGNVDAVYDRGALEAINVEDRDKYVSIMRSATQGKDFRYLLHGFEYDLSLFQGPPRALHKDLINKLFGDFCEIEIVSETVDKKYEKALNVEKCVEIIYLMKPKN